MKIRLRLITRKVEFKAIKKESTIKGLRSKEVFDKTAKRPIRIELTSLMVSS